MSGASQERSWTAPAIPQRGRRSVVHIPHAAIRRCTAGGWLLRPLRDHRLVVIIIEATDAACCSADRTTLVGSMMPAFTKSLNSPVWASKPQL